MKIKIPDASFGVAQEACGCYFSPHLYGVVPNQPTRCSRPKRSRMSTHAIAAASLLTMSGFFCVSGYESSPAPSRLSRLSAVQTDHRTTKIVNITNWMRTDSIYKLPCGLVAEPCGLA